MESHSEQVREDVFLDLFSSHQVQIYAYVRAILRHREDADDLFQEISITLWEKFDAFEPGTNFIAWACQIARFHIANFVRRKSRSRVYFSDVLQLQLAEVQSQQDSKERTARREALRECVKKLRPADQELITQRYANLLSVSELAERIGRPARGIHNSLARIRQALLECINRTLLQEERA